MRTNIDIDDELIREAMRLTDAQTKKEVVHVALQELIRARKKKSLADLAGRVRLRDGYDPKTMRKLRNSGSR